MSFWFICFHWTQKYRTRMCALLIGFAIKNSSTDVSRGMFLIPVNVIHSNPILNQSEPMVGCKWLFSASLSTLYVNLIHYKQYRCSHLYLLLIYPELIQVSMNLISLWIRQRWTKRAWSLVNIKRFRKCYIQFSASKG